MGWPKGKSRKGHRAITAKSTTSALPAPAPAQVPVMVDPDVYAMLQFASRVNGVSESAIIRAMVVRKPLAKV